jgi:surfactin family lipopeptide synthetase A
VTQFTLPQQDIYYEQLLYPGKAIYNIGASISIAGDLSFAMMEEAYQQLVAQHDAFRTVIHEDGFEVLATYNVKLGFVDFSSTENGETAAINYMQADFIQPFDLFCGKPLHRFCLVKVRDGFHYLYSVYHHIITDGWGTSLLFQRLVKNYNELKGSGIIQSQYPFSYTSFVADDQQYRTGEAWQQDKDYWVNRFATIPAILVPGTGEPESRRKELMVPRVVYDRLGGSAFHTILGLLYTYLGRYYGNSDFAIGLPVLNRDKAVFKKTVGLFMGLSPLRMVLDYEETFEALVGRIKAQLRQDYRHQRFPLGQLVRELGMHPLFSVTLSYEKHNYADAFAGTVTKVIPLTHGAERVPLAIYIREFDPGEAVKIDFDYSVHSFSEPAIQQLVSNFEYLLQTLDFSTPLKAMRFLTEWEGQHNHAGTAYKKTVPDLIDEQVGISPHAIAVQDAGHVYSYLELKSISDSIAAYLCDTLDDKGPVAVLMDRSADLVVLLLGVLKSGRAYIPLDPTFPAARLAYIVADSNAATLIHNAHYKGLSGGNVNAIRVESIFENIEQKEHEINITQSAAAYIIYTSGSTGNPKGVEISHGALLNFLTSMQTLPGIQAGELLYAVTTYSFDISILEFFLPLISGASTYIADSDTLSDPVRVIAALHTLQPDIIQATPGFYQILFNAGWEGSLHLKVLCGGDLLSTALAEKLLSVSAELWNMYGPTETTIWSGIKRIQHPGDARNIGRPINKTSFYILDPWLQPVPVGAEGEIYIGGAGLASGYYLNDALTRTRFLDVFGTRLYRTGDSGKWNDKGEILFSGRKDDQVKVRGYRIELEEIERNLVALDEIDEAVVVARKNVDQDAFLAGFVRTTAQTFSPRRIIEKLRESLPEYMIPKVIVALGEFPLTLNKKIDRKALSQYDLSQVDLPGVTEAPVDQDAIMLAGLWATVLGTPVNDMNSHFFSLGGHSIKAAQLVRSVNEYFHLQLSLKDIFEHPVLREQVSLIRSKVRTTYVSIPRVPEQPVYDIAAPQRMIWLACQQPQVSVTYNMYGAFEITGDTTWLEAGIQSLVETHEVLRTNFVEIQGQPKQVVRTAYPFVLQQFEVADEHAAAGFITDMVHTAFDLEKDPLLRVCLVRTEARSILVFVTHHLVMDGWSLDLFVKNLAAVQIPPIQYRDYAAWSNQQQDTAARQYWLNRLDTFQPSESFKRDGHRRSFKGAKIDFYIGNDIRQLAVEFGCSLFTVVLAAVQALIYKSNGQADNCVGIPVAGREHPDVKDLLGMFVNTLAFRNQVFGSFKNLCTHTKALLAESLEYTGYQLEEIPFDVMVAWQQQEVISWKKVPVTHQVSRLPVTFSFTDMPDGIVCEVEYDTGLYEETTIQIIISRYQRLLELVMQDRATAISELDIELESEKRMKARKITIDFNF